jgi:hypothetical protein
MTTPHSGTMLFLRQSIARSLTGFFVFRKNIDSVPYLAAT